MVLFFSFSFSFFPPQIYSPSSFSLRMVPHTSYFALNCRDASAIIMYGVQVSRAIRGAGHVDVGNTSRAPSPYDSFTILPDNNNDNVSLTIRLSCRAESSFFFFYYAGNQEARGTATNDRKNNSRDLHRAFRSFFPTLAIFLLFS